MVFETADAFLASPSQLPDFIRKSRYATFSGGVLHVKI